MRSYETIYTKNDYEVIHRLEGGSGKLELWERYMEDRYSRARFIKAFNTLQEAKDYINRRLSR